MQGIENARSLVLDVSSSDGNTTGLLLGRLVDGVVSENCAGAGSLSEDLGDSGGEGGFAVAVVVERKREEKKNELGGNEGRGRRKRTRRDRWFYKE
jgi:hypothetical protein